MLVEPSHLSAKLPVNFRRAGELQTKSHILFGDEKLSDLR